MTATPDTVSPAAVPPQVLQMRELAHSAVCAAAIRAAARLGVADVLGDEPASAPDLARQVGADPDALLRLMRALACYGVFVQQNDELFAHTDTSRLLREDAPRSLKYNALWATEPWAWEVLPRLEDAIRTGTSVFPELHDKEFFAYLHADAPESAAVFDKAMTHSSRLSALAIADVVGISGARTIADIAGGQGFVLATMLERHPGLRGVLFDLPDVVAAPDARLRPGGTLAGRASVVAGDCRREVNVEADIYLMKNILEWDDESTVLSLRNVARAGRPGARVIVLENLVDGSPEMKFTTAMDMLLLLNVGGKKHTKAGLRALIERAGLTVQRVQQVNNYLHMFESTIARVFTP